MIFYCALQVNIQLKWVNWVIMYIDQIDQGGTVKFANRPSESRVNEIRLKKGHKLIFHIIFLKFLTTIPILITLNT